MPCAASCKKCALGSRPTLWRWCKHIHSTLVSPHLLPGNHNIMAASSSASRMMMRRGQAQPQLRSAAGLRAAPRPFVAAKAALKALIFDCDGVILESEDLHRRAYNATFQHFNVCCPGQQGCVDWTDEFYDMLQNKVGGGKPKMRWYFGLSGWPTSSVLGGKAPANEDEQAQLIDTLQDWKSDKYQQMIGSGEVEPRPGVLRLMDEARAAGVLVAVCSAATKSSVVFTLKNLLGEQRFAELDCFLAGDDVDKKKPDPTIYKVAAEKLGVQPSECVVVEDSSIGLQAARGAGMRCIITYTPSTKSQMFGGAERIVQGLGFPANITVQELAAARVVQDDRINMDVTDSAVLWHLPNQ